MRLSWIGQLWQQRELITRLTQREVQTRYRGSVVGWGWTILTPLLMLTIYTFVFSSIFKARWESTAELGSAGFALNIFTGMVVFGLFSECATRAPTLITSHSNYVTKVRFPLETLGCTVVGNGLFHALTSLVILLVFRLAATGSFPWSSICLPLVWLPYVLLALAMTWILSALGVYLRDLGQVVTVATSALMFMSAVFYPLSALPERWAPLFKLNPIAWWIEETRALIVLDHWPNPGVVTIQLVGAIVICELALRLFRKASRGFADVL
jgi:lipopolysaccharide transport system permease protein